MLGIYIRTSKEGDKEESPIEQQKREGKVFAEKNDYRFEVYEDRGISGFKIADDETDPFKNRPGFVSLIDDIRSKKIDSVWVWEHSRLSRNQFASAIIFNIFEKNEVKIFEKDKEFKYTDPQSKMIRGILDIMSEYERSLIVSRTKRGLHSRINQGKRSFGRLYGYEKIGLDANGHQILGAVESEMENIKYSYKRILEGATLKEIAMKLYNKSMDTIETMCVSRNLHRTLRHFSYTGFELNIAGLEILKRFEKFEIPDLSALKDPSYYVPSKNYPISLISVEDWIRVVERMHFRGGPRKRYHNKKASKDLATGLIECSQCGDKFYSYVFRSESNGRRRCYNYYKHFIKLVKTTDCTQKRSFSVRNVNEAFKLFYFYFLLLFDDTTEMVTENLCLIKRNQDKAEEEVRRLQSEEKLLKTRITKFNEVLEKENDVNSIKILAHQIGETETKQKKNLDDLEKAKAELKSLKERYSETEAVNVYYNVINRIREFFKSKNIEEQRDELITIIKKCKIFQYFLAIEAGKVLFVFDLKTPYRFDETLLDRMDTETVYKEYFVYMISKEKQFLNLSDVLRESDIKQKTLETNKMAIYDCKLNGPNSHFHREVLERLLKERNIDYDCSNISNVLFLRNNI